MNRFLDKTLLNVIIVSIIIIAGWYFIHPYYQYYLDADAVAYLTIAKRYAIEDYSQAINGMWSPLNIWLLVPFIRNGYDPFQSAQFINMIIAALIVPSFYLLMERFQLKDVSKNIILIILTPVLIYFSYLQVFGDLLSVLIWIWILDIMLSPMFTDKPWKIMFVCVLGALSYLAKSYNFYYFPLVFIAAILIFNNSESQKKPTYWRIGYGLSIFLMTCFPWIFILHEKYHIWTSGLSGKLNMTWYLINHREYDSRYHVLVPPSYPDSPSFWEDPWLVQGSIHYATESIKMLMHKLMRIGYAINEGIMSMNQISSFVVLALVFSIVIISTKNYISQAKLKILAIASLFLPIGYILVHVESRYLWLLLFISLVMIFWVIERLKLLQVYRHLRWMLYLIIAITYWAYPMIDMETIFMKGKDRYEIATVLKDKKLIHQNFISNISGGELWKVAYLSDNYFFETKEENFSEQDLINDIDKNNIEFFLYFTEEDKPKYNTYIGLLERHGFGEISQNKIPTMRIFIRPISNP